MSLLDHKNGRDPGRSRWLRWFPKVKTRTPRNKSDINAHTKMPSAAVQAYEHEGPADDLHAQPAHMPNDTDALVSEALLILENLPGSIAPSPDQFPKTAPPTDVDHRGEQAPQ